MKKSTAQIQKCVVLSHSFAEYASSSLLFEYIVNSFKNIFSYRQGKKKTFWEEAIKWGELTLKFRLLCFGPPPHPPTPHDSLNMPNIINENKGP